VQDFKVFDMPFFKDQRGSFSKVFNDSLFKKAGIEFVVKESYFSVSQKDVIRGMHFQLPPYQHAKIVFCPFGAILDVVVDLRSGSPEYGQCFSELLSAENNKACYIPEGFAHGFKSLTDGSITSYLVSGEYEAASDTGIAFDSIAFDWACSRPSLSERDQHFAAFLDFKSPF
jgi:dTDP-4-dehydrorhamnose 3,5-epimerase